MTTPERPGIPDQELDATLRAWLKPGPAALSEPRHPARPRVGPCHSAGAGLARHSLDDPQPPGTQVRRCDGRRAHHRGGPGPGHAKLRAAGRRGPSSLGAQQRLRQRRPRPRARAPCRAPTPIVSADTLNGVVAATGATYEVRYPQVGGLDPAAAATINTLLRERAEAAVHDFMSGIGKDPQAGPNQPSTLQVDYSVATNSPDLISLRVNSYSYPSGAAHGSAVLTTFTFDPSSGRRIALADLFRPGRRVPRFARRRGSGAAEGDAGKLAHRLLHHAVARHGNRTDRRQLRRLGDHARRP